MLQERDCPLEQAVASAVQEQCRQTSPYNVDLVSLSCDLQADFDKARSWPELQGRLKLAGYTLRNDQRGILICEARSRLRICRIDGIGQSESDLTRRFGRRFPTAIQRWDMDGQLDAGQFTPDDRLPRKQSFRPAARLG